MICIKCNTEGVESIALDKTFFYCRTCKQEIGLEVVLEEPPQVTYRTYLGIGDLVCLMGHRGITYIVKDVYPEKYCATLKAGVIQLRVDNPIDASHLTMLVKASP